MKTLIAIMIMLVPAVGWAGDCGQAMYYDAFYRGGESGKVLFVDERYNFYWDWPKIYFDAPKGTHWENRDDELFKYYIIFENSDLLTVPTWTLGPAEVVIGPEIDDTPLFFTDREGEKTLQAEWDSLTRTLKIKRMGGAQLEFDPAIKINFMIEED